MPDPETPRRRADLVSRAAPSPEKVQEWRQGVRKTTAGYIRQTKSLLDDLEELLTTQKENFVTREAMAFVLREKLRTICACQDYDLDGREDRNEGYSDDEAPEATDDVTHPCTNEARVAEAEDPDEDSEYLGEDSEDLDEGADDFDEEVENLEEGTDNLDEARAYHSSGERQVDDTLSLSPEASAPDDPGNAWLNALADLGVVQGDGSADRPLYVGAKHRRKAPQLTQVEIDIDGVVNTERMKEIQHGLLSSLSAFSWQARHNRTLSHLKLHPWAAIGWVNLFTGNLLGLSGLKKVSQIVEAATAQNIHGDTSLDAERALALSHDPEVDELERSFYAAMAATLTGEVTTKNVHVKYQKQIHSAAIAVQFEAMVKDLKVRMAATKTRGNEKLSVRGHSAKDVIAEVCSKRMRWTLERFWNFIQRYQHLSKLVASFSTGFLLLAPNNFESEIKSNAKAAMPQIVTLVEKEFPELRAICFKVQTLVEQELSSQDTAGKRRRRKIELKLGNADMIDRLEAFLAA